MKNRPNLRLEFIPRPPDPMNSVVATNLKIMDYENVQTIYREIEQSKKRFTNLVYYNICTINDRTIIFVKSIDIDGKTVDINHGFYQSTGTSRNTGIAGIWFPTTMIELNLRSIRLLKPEDIFIEFPNAPETVAMHETLLKYLRFITFELAAVSYFLSHYDVPIVKILESKNIPCGRLGTEGRVLYEDLIYEPEPNIIRGQK